MSKCVAPGLTVRGAGKILLRTVDQAITRAVERRRSARYAARRRQRLGRALFWISAVFVGLAFAGGFIWRSGWLRPPAVEAAPVAVPAEQRAGAYQLLDEAVRARHEERAQGALNAATRARNLDPDVPGLDFFVAEVAWQNRDAMLVRHAAGESLRRGHNVSGSKLLLALVKWSTRNVDDSQVVGASVVEMLSEVAGESPSDSAAYFFHGEVSRLLGDGAAAHRQLLGALHRQVPWTSATLLSTKEQLVAAEALRLSRPAVAPSPDAASQAVLGLLRASEETSVRREFFGNVINHFSLLQIAFLFEDPALAGWTDVADLSPIIGGRGAATVPHAGVR
jgi:hypothetical protein